MRRTVLALSLLLAVPAFAVPAFAVPAFAATPQEILSSHVAQAVKENPSFRESAARGDQFFHAKRAHSNGKTLSCATCHTDNPKATGKNDKTGKDILPLAPSANRERLTNTADVDKWFKRNCQDVYERACTAQEKADFLAFLVNVK